MDSIAILDFGSQYAQIIARRVREAQVYCELFPWDASMEQILAISLFRYLTLILFITNLFLSRSIIRQTPGIMRQSKRTRMYGHDLKQLYPA